MKSVIGIAYSYFFMVPLQRWLNIAGLVLLAAGLALGKLFTGGQQATGYVLIVFGLITIGITPVFAGGVGLRFASTRTMLHLRPNGRIKLLLGSTLTITLLAAAPLLLGAVEAWTDPPNRRANPDPAMFLTVFEISWAALAVMWIGIFAISRTMLAFALMGLLPIVGGHLGRYLIPMLPSYHWVFYIGAAAWIAFALWFMRTPSVERPIMPAGGASMSQTGLEGTHIFTRLTEIGAPRGPLTREHAAYMYLFGVASPWFYVALGLWVGSIFLVVAMVSTGGRLSVGAQMLAMIPFYVFFNASLGYTAARRARYLWLRTDHTRRGLFAACGGWTTRSAMLAWGVTGAMVLAAALIAMPHRGIELTAFVLLQALMAMAMGYLGLAMTREWSFLDILVCAAFGVLFVGQVLFLTPRRDPVPLQNLGAALVIAGALVAALRMFAASRWLGLDWRVAKLSKFMAGKG